MVKAEYSADNTHACMLCPHHCKISPGKSGICGVRKNKDNVIITDNFNKISSLAFDPVEKKPLYHYYPGSRILSAGTFGCNLKCPYCQNWQISQSVSGNYREMSSEDLIETALGNDVNLLAYTYSEPIVWYEYVKQTSISAIKAGIKNVMITNGMINPDPLKEISSYIDAWNIDLKTSDRKVFSKVHKGHLDTVMHTISYLSGKAHVEITALIVTGINDNLNDFTGIVDFIASIDKRIPLHVTRYFPAYNYSAPATDPEIMHRFYDIANTKLDYVYCGNLLENRFSDTFCPACGELLIKRNNYDVKVKSLKDGSCSVCGNEIYGKF
ncbi:MAG: AmmeMemoRadiSam system radical SAM enzyme [Spirochaetes bacterium]|nr:AmmeMemoRadiSam system radical SAM enzyme [Spirochaetota bacterium]